MTYACSSVDRATASGAVCGGSIPPRRTILDLTPMNRHSVLWGFLLFYVFQGKGDDTMVSFSLKVRFYETDLMGVVHHANYLRWFEMGRVEYLRQAGIDLNEMMGEGFMVPIVDVNCRYRQSARFDDEVIIETVLEKLSKVKLSFSYRALRAKDGVLLAEGKTTNGITTAEGKVARLSDSYMERLNKMLEEERETRKEC